MVCNTYFKLWKAFVVWFLYQGIWDSIQCTTAALDVQLCPDEWSFFGTKCYKGFGLTLSERETWNSSNSKCLDMKTSLVSIHSREEGEFVARMFPDQGGLVRVWVGLYKHMSPSGPYSKWTDNSTLVYSNWSKNQPSHTYKGKYEECVDMYVHTSTSHGQWNDESCDNPHMYACQINLENTCVLNPCKHGAVCTQDGIKGSFNCSCTHGYTGRTCEEKILCDDNTCRNGGTCMLDGANGLFRCLCSHGYQGLFCKYKIMCGENTCKNEGTCIKDGSDEGFRCECSHGYQGLTCEEKILCDYSICKNGGSCVIDGPADVFRCECSHGYEGMTCEQKILCGNNTCRNRGICMQDGPDGVIKCNCSHGYQGLTCEQKILCDYSTCKNGGSCVIDGPADVFRCECSHGYQGMTCEQSVIPYEVEHVGGEGYILRGNVVLQVKVDVKIH